jgi:hypothetical protein
LVCDVLLVFPVVRVVAVDDALVCDVLLVIPVVRVVTVDETFV